MNYGGTLANKTFLSAWLHPTESHFRSRFPCRYYIIDFELSVKFPVGCPTSDCTVEGLPYYRGLDPEETVGYGKVGAPIPN